MTGCQLQVQEMERGWSVLYFGKLGMTHCFDQVGQTQETVKLKEYFRKKIESLYIYLYIKYKENFTNNVQDVFLSFIKVSKYIWLFWMQNCQLLDICIFAGARCLFAGDCCYFAKYTS